MNVFECVCVSLSCGLAGNLLALPDEGGGIDWINPTLRGRQLARGHYQMPFTPYP